MKRYKKELKHLIAEKEATFKELIKSPNDNAPLIYKNSIETIMLKRMLRGTSLPNINRKQTKKHILEPAAIAILHKMDKNTSGLICPSCGAADYGNTLNGKPFCVNCNVELISKNSNLHKKMLRIKVLKGKYSKNVTFKELR